MSHMSPYAGPSNVQQFYADKDRAASQQLVELKKAAQACMDDILTKIQEQVAAARSHKDTISTIDTQQLKTKVKYAVEAMQEGLVERDTEVRLLMLAALCGEHVLFIGPPGTAKSEIGRRLSKLIHGTYFERLLTRFSVPEELFGPLSMRALEEDKYVRQTRGYLPEAQVAFIDEIFKANSAILNTLLTVLNERLFDNGSQRVKVPLISMVGASNELPESEELDALYDRFLVRKQVQQVTASGLTQMLDYYAGNADDGNSDNGNGSPGPSFAQYDPGMRLSPAEFVNTRLEAAKCVRVPQNVIQLLADLRTFLQEKIEPPVYVSDRRLVKAVGLLQVAAYCNGRDVVTEYDCLLLEHILWQQPEQANRIADWVLSQLAVDDGIKQVHFLLSGAFSRACKALGGANEKVEEIRQEVAQLRQLLVDKLVQVTTNLEGDFPVVQDNLWLGQDVSASVATSLVPKLQKTKTSVEELLYQVATLEVALQAGTNAVTLANLMPKHWADFIRNSPLEEVRPIGTTPMRI
eukprot:jgi/Chrzof1/10727/Cz05g10070.t1